MRPLEVAEEDEYDRMNHLVVECILRRPTTTQAMMMSSRGLEQTSGLVAPKM
jgi:hypothetical protein